MENTEIYPTTAWSAGPGCHGGCGQKLFVQDGKLVRVEGDENNPWNQGRSCPRVLALKQYVYHPDRITKPLKRVGERGEGKFEPINWDEAFEFCEHRLKEIREKYGAESAIFAQGTGRDIGGPISFLAYSFGSPNLCQLGLSGQSCYTPRLGAMKAVMGDLPSSTARSSSNSVTTIRSGCGPRSSLPGGRIRRPGAPTPSMGTGSLIA